MYTASSGACSSKVTEYITFKDKSTKNVLKLYLGFRLQVQKIDAEHIHSCICGRLSSTSPHHEDLFHLVHAHLETFVEGQLQLR